MNVTKADLVILNNATFQASIELKESDIPIDLTGYNFYMQCRPSYQSSTVYFEVTSNTNGGIVIDPTHGKFTITIPASQTSQFTFLDGVYDVIAVKSDGTQLRAMEGNVFIDFGTTQV
jgi:hypothetical protein